MAPKYAQNLLKCPKGKLVGTNTDEQIDYRGRKWQKAIEWRTIGWTNFDQIIRGQPHKYALLPFLTNKLIKSTKKWKLILCLFFEWRK